MNSKVEVVEIHTTKIVSPFARLVELGASLLDVAESIFINKGEGRRAPYIRSFTCSLLLTHAYPCMREIAVYTMKKNQFRAFEEVYIHGLEL